MNHRGTVPSIALVLDHDCVLLTVRLLGCRFDVLLAGSKHVVDLLACVLQSLG